ncbi:MAG: imidazole glycerol phosphate synthase subunit HisH [Gammaproteobacteria bacterium]|nr:MAG: imidazole glycerol phosphate synthase subunit HisH [Gammaproteobacteria bacterium]
MNRIAVVDYGMGNLHSVSKALEHAAPGARVVVTADPDVVRKADRVVFPGVGAIRDCMAEIRRLGFDELVRDVVASGRPMLGICVGMQALMRESEENGGVACINLFDDPVRFFGEPLTDAEGTRLKVPHMGWNQVAQTTHHPMWANIENLTRFYFVHSFYVPASAPECVGRTEYGVELAAAVARDNIFATQFHPEKSQHAGLQLLANFANWTP